MVNKRYICFACFVLMSFNVSAKNVSTDQDVVGNNTRQWLSTQRDGSEASEQQQPISGPVADKIYQRYQQSFTHPIPEHYTGDDADASVLNK